MIIPLKSLFPTAHDVLDADLETLGGLLLKHLRSCQGVSPVFQHGGLYLDYFIAIMERRNIGLGPLPSKEPEYGAEQPAVSRAFVEAWDWLVREGLLVRNHQQPGEFYLISRRGEKFLQNEDRQNRGDVKAKGTDRTTTPGRNIEAKKWDVFISHASEDKPYVERLVNALRAAGMCVWYDNMVMTWGDDLRQTIDSGLASCRFAIVVLSKAFLTKKKWTEHELNGLFARETAGQKVVLPIWHEITRDDLLSYSPALADRLAKISSTDSPDNIVSSLCKLMGKSDLAGGASSGSPTSDVYLQKRQPASRIARGASQESDDLGPREIELLWNATRDPKGEILYSRTLSGEALRSNGRQFLEDAEARTAAEWLGALRRLEMLGLIEPLSSDRDFFRLTSEGYEAADRLEGFARWNAQSIVLRAYYINAPTEEHVIDCKGIIALPPRYLPDQVGADGTVVRSLRERRALLVEGIDKRLPEGWNPTEVEFDDQITGQSQVFRVEGATVLPLARLKIPVLD